MSRQAGMGPIPGFLIALVAGAAVGSVVQTQFNLLALQQLGVEIALATRLSATAQDLLHFAPLYAAVFGVSFLASTLITGAALKLLGWPARSFFHALGAATGLWLTFTLVNTFAPMPTLIAATRTSTGLAAMALAAAFAGWLYARLTATRAGATGGDAPVWLLAALAGAPGLAPEAQAQTAAHYQIQELAVGLSHPWSLAFLPDGGALITERSGQLRRLTPNGALSDSPIAGVPPVFVSGQAGLFDVTLAPDFPDSRRVLLSYACGTASANHLCLARARLGAQGLEQVTEIFRTHPAKRGNAHYGGRMAWLPDGSLVVGLGDGFDYREQAQILGNHLGSLVRLWPDGSVPDDNPLVSESGARPEIYSYGHRNVQGLVYDPVGERLISHEHGPRGGDEINLIRPGANYGWPVVSFGRDYTGALVTPFTERAGMAPPLLQWTPSIAPSGMTLYRGELFPQWQGDLLIGALAERSVHRVSLAGGQARDVEVLFQELEARIRDVITGPDGALYLLTDSENGQLLRIAPK